MIMVPHREPGASGLLQDYGVGEPAQSYEETGKEAPT
jgi:hypothetical protein